MTKKIVNIFAAIFQVIAALYHLLRYAYVKFSIKVLKPHFGIETPAYKRYWAKRSAKIQEALDKEHEKKFKQESAIIIPA